MALLNIFAPKSPHTFTRLFHIPAIRDITLEHLQLLSNQLLAPPLPGEQRRLSCVSGSVSCFIGCLLISFVVVSSLRWHHQLQLRPPGSVGASQPPGPELLSL